MELARFLMCRSARFGFSKGALKLLTPFVILLVLGCSANDSVKLIGLRDEKALHSQSLGGGDLVSANSLFVAKVVVLPSVQADSVEVDGFYEKIIAAFSAETGIDVIRDAAPKPHMLITKAGALELNERAQKTGADVVLTTTITKYSDKSGSALGSSRAALLAAQFSVIRLKDNKEIWSSNYFSTEQPNTYNLLEVTRRLGRDRGTELPAFSILAQEAAKRAALDFAERRTAQFIKK